jgi:2-polyprenyl-6-methoxyphenol hydroxylase-like FAD-dependent oxidoreductase
LRANFDGVSSEYVQASEEAGSAKYEYGYNVTSVKYDENSKEVVVSFQDRDKMEKTARTSRVFAADGPSSMIRGLMMPDIKRQYAGYVAWRGTVVETQVSKATSDAFVEKFTFFHDEGIQVFPYVTV